MASTRIVDHLGRVLGSRYRLIAPIGTGASAHVFLADDVRLRRRVAVKVLHPALADDVAFLRRFRAEARAVAALNHPNLLSVYDWGEEADGPFIVSEYLSGGSLRSLLDRGHRLTLSQALMVGLEAARGLDYAHRRGLVHRDVKPANLLFDDDGRLRIADFGVARALAEAAWTEPAGAVLGTARYASPEQVQSAPLDGKSDVYSLALVLVEAVTGRVPFAADTTIATLMARVETPLDPPAEMGVLRPALQRAGVTDPSERVDALSLAATLQSVAGELPSPGPLPLVGPDVDDALLDLSEDPTDLGGGGGSSAVIAPRADDPAAAPAPTVFDREADDAPTVPVPVIATSATSAPAGTTVEEVDEAPPRRRRRRWPWVVLLVLVLAGGGGAATWAVMKNRVPSHPVPNLISQTEADAVAALRPFEFEVIVRHEFVDETEPGRVTAQEPPGGELKEGRTVVLTVSLGPTPVPIPDLTGLDEGAAREKVEAVGLKVANLGRQHNEEAPTGQVLDWAPKEGTQPKGSTVDIVVSAGPAPRVIPEVNGQSFDDAAAALRAKGLEAGRTDIFSDTVPAGRVVSSNPRAGASVERGSRVTLTVSKGQPAVPDLRGSNVADATAKLEGAGLKVGNVYGPSGGKVFLSTPAAGTTVRLGAAVNLYIA